MKWQRNLDGVHKKLVGDARVPEPITPYWENRCWTCKFGSVRTFLSVTCSVTGKRMVPCTVCEVP